MTVAELKFLLKDCDPDLIVKINVTDYGKIFDVVNAGKCPADTQYDDPAFFCIEV
jgi:hypothetical protein